MGKRHNGAVLVAELHRGRDVLRIRIDPEPRWVLVIRIFGMLPWGAAPDVWREIKFFEEIFPLPEQHRDGPRDRVQANHLTNYVWVQREDAATAATGEHEGMNSRSVGLASDAAERVELQRDVGPA